MPLAVGELPKKQSQNLEPTRMSQARRSSGERGRKCRVQMPLLLSLAFLCASSVSFLKLLPNPAQVPSSRDSDEDLCAKASLRVLSGASYRGVREVGQSRR